MDDSVPFSVLNERLRPRFTAMERLCYSLNTLEARSTGSLRSSTLTARPTILSTKPEHPVTRETRYTGSLRSSSLTVRPTILSTKPEPKDPVTTAEPEEPEYYSEEDDLVDDGLPEEEEENSTDLLPIINQCLVPTLNVEDVDSVGQKNNSPSLTEESDSPDTTAGTGEGPEPVALTSDGSLSQSYLDGTLPDLIRSGRPLSRRRTLGPVSDTLKEVRREVELSRRRSLKLKAQVDQLQSRDGPGWSQHRERVTEEVLSILRLLHPLTEPESGLAEPSAQGNCLDAALSQLQNVARTLAISHTKQESKAVKGNGEEDSAVLQQALWDRDEAIEKKKAMEAELLRSKTEMMLLNNQLLEAVQKHLELSLELEAWKDDVQLILHQQLQSQQQAEQAQRKPSRMGLLRRNNRPPIQKPTSFPLPAPTVPSTNSNHIFISRTSLTFPPHNTPTPTPAPAPVASAPPTGTQRNWRDRLKMGKNSRQGDQDAAGQGSSSQGWGKDKDGFQVVSLD